MQPNAARSGISALHAQCLLIEVGAVLLQWEVDV